MRNALLTLLLFGLLAAGANPAGFFGGYVGARVRGGAVVSEPWTPADLTGLALWLDASDAGTLWADTNATTAATNNGLVARWDDKSGNARHGSQSDTAKRPVLKTGKHPHSHIDTAGDFKAFAITPFTATNNIRFTAVLMPLDSAGRNGAFATFTDFTGSNPAFSGNASGPTDWYDSFFSTARPRVSSVSITNNILYLLFVEQTGSQIKGRVFGYVSESAVNATFNGSPTTRFQLPSTATDLQSGNYDMCEVVMTQSETTNNLQRTEGYLAHKWGLADNLPADHPYKSAPPTK